MSGQWEFSKAGYPGHHHIVEDDILEINTAGGKYAAQIVLRMDQAYVGQEGTRWIDGKRLAIDVLPFQVQEIVEGNRKKRTAFCHDCFDYGKRTTPPASCASCLLLEACRLSGKGDFRKTSVPLPSRPSRTGWMPLAFMVLCCWFFIWQWAEASRTIEKMQDRLNVCNKSGPRAGK